MRDPARPRRRPNPLRIEPRRATTERQAGHGPDPSLGARPATARAAAIAYLDRMLVENTKLNLTAIREREAALALHVDDSLELGRVIDRTPGVILDLGSGNGFPGVAAACLWPSARVVLIERTQKKCAAIRRCLDDSGLTRVETLAIDAAQAPALAPELRGIADLITARALGDLGTALELAAPLLAPRGVIVQWKADDVPSDERRAALVTARRLGLTALEDHLYQLGARERRLVRFRRPERPPTSERTPTSERPPTSAR